MNNKNKIIKTKRKKIKKRKTIKKILKNKSLFLGGGKRNLDYINNTNKRQSCRLNNLPNVETKELGRGNNNVSEYEISKFVNDKITEGRQIVSLPVPPTERHAFVVDIHKNGSEKIMIADWVEDSVLERGIDQFNRKNIRITNTNRDFRIYSKFMEELEKKYGIQIEFYPVDQELYAIAEQHHNEHDHGGCANYAYAWVEKYK